MQDAFRINEDALQMREFANIIEDSNPINFTTKIANGCTVITGHINESLCHISLKQKENCANTMVVVSISLIGYDRHLIANAIEYAKQKYSRLESKNVVAQFEGSQWRALRKWGLNVWEHPIISDTNGYIRSYNDEPVFWMEF